MPETVSTNPTVDVVIVNYNYRRFVGTAIASALDQEEPFDRVIVVDDGSTDGSLDEIERYVPQVTVVCKANGGQLSACLAGLASCRSDYICFLDADDYLIPDAGRHIRRSLQDRPVKAQFQLVGVDAEGCPTNSLFPVFPNGYDSAQMIQDNRTIGYYTSPPTSGNVFSCRFLRDRNLSRLDQRDFIDGVPNLLAPHFGEVASVNVPTACYRVHGSNHSQWGLPTFALLSEEINWLGRRWREASKLTDSDVVIPDLDASLYVLERRLMIAALSSPTDVDGAVRRFLEQLRETRMSRLTAAALGLWARLLRVPSRQMRRRLVLSRRSPGQRPRIINLALVNAKRASAAIHAYGQAGSKVGR